MRAERHRGSAIIRVAHTATERSVDAAGTVARNTSASADRRLALRIVDRDHIGRDRGAQSLPTPGDVRQETAGDGPCPSRGACLDLRRTTKTFPLLPDDDRDARLRNGRARSDTRANADSDDVRKSAEASP